MKKKNGKILLLLLLISFVCLIKAKADYSDYSGGSIGNTGGLGSGAWYPEFVGLKISIVDKNNKFKETEIILNKKIQFLSNYAKLSQTMKPKTKYTGQTGVYYNIFWLDYDNIKTYVYSELPAKWINNGKNINMYNILQQNDYKKLKAILETTGAFNPLSSGDYILVEPMVYIGGYYGTAFELLNAFGGDLNKCNKHFCYWYTGAVFGGNPNKMGLLYDTLYVNTEVKKVNLKNILAWIEDNNTTGENWKKRNKCLRAKTCGRGIGVFEYNKVYDVPEQPTPTPTPDKPLTDCEQELKKLGDSPSPKELVELYNSRNEIENKKYNGLLNFNDPKCEIKKCENNYEYSCMFASHGDKGLDFSCTELKDYNGVLMLCKKHLLLQNEISFDKSLVQEGINFSANRDDIISGVLTQTCYSPSKIQVPFNQVSFNNYSFLIEKVGLQSKSEKGQQLLESNIWGINEGNISETGNDSDGYIYEKISRSSYGYPIVYSVKGSAETTIDKDDDICKEIIDGETYNICENIGRGIVIPFNGDKEQKFDFYYTYEGKTYEALCTIETDSPACDPNDPNGCDLNLEFRTIDTKNPFAGRGGKIRNVGNNWCKIGENIPYEGGTVERYIESCSGNSSENDTIKTYITNKNNSYNITQEGAKYTIELTPSKIKEIRTYNKGKAYDDFRFMCDDNGNNCKSAFLREYGFIN